MSLHFLCGINCAAQVVEVDENSGLLTAIIVIGLPKVIGGPFLAGLLSVRVANFTEPTFTLPKFFGVGLTFSPSGT